MKFSKAIFVAMLASMNLGLVACGGDDLQDGGDAHKEETKSTQEWVEQFVVVAYDDGLFTVRKVYISFEENERLIREKELAMASLQSGKDKPSEVVTDIGYTPNVAPRIVELPTIGGPYNSQGPDLKPQLYWADDTTGNCYSSDLWMHTAINQGGSRICFRKNTVSGVGTTNLHMFYNGGVTVASGTRSWWSGYDTGYFIPVGGGASIPIPQYHKCDSCGVLNYPNLGFN